MASMVENAARQLQVFGSSMSEADLKVCAERGQEVSMWLLAQIAEEVTDDKVIISALSVLGKFLHLLANSLAGLTLPAVAELKKVLLNSIAVTRTLTTNKTEDRIMLTDATEKAAMELFDGVLAVVSALFNFLPQAQSAKQDALISCACEVHASTLALAKTALDTKSPLAPRLWKNVGEQLQCASIQPALEQLLFSVPETVLYLLQYAALQLKVAVRTWSQSEKETDQLQDRRMAAPIRHGLLTVLRITASCPTRVATQPCILELSSLHIIVHSLASSQVTQLPASFRTLLTKSVGEAMHAVLAMVLESEPVSDASKCFLVQALCASELTREMEATATLRTFEGEGDLQKMLPSGRLASFCSLLSHSSKYSLAVQEELANQLRYLHKVVQDTYPSLLAQSGPQNQYDSLLQSLATFAVVAEASGSSVARQAVESFLFENALRCHPLVQELVLDLWGFVFELSEPSLQDAHLSSLFNVLSGLVVAETAQQQGNTLPTQASSRDKQRLTCAITNVARITNQLLTAANLKQLDLAYTRCIEPVDRSLAEARTCEVLLRNGFPVERLSAPRQKDLFGSFVETLIVAAKEEVESVQREAVSRKGDRQLQVQLQILEIFLKNPFFERHGSQTSAQAASQLALRCFALQDASLMSADLTDDLHKPALRLLIASHQHVPPDKLWALLPLLRTLCRDESADPSPLKPALADFLATLSSVPMPESGPEVQALVELYHFLLRERHWALAHLALVSFTQFAATSSYADLWRLVPPDAVAGTFEGKLAGQDMSEYGQEVDGFMRALQSFLEQTVGNNFCPLSSSELANLGGEGKMLEEQASEKLVVQSACRSDIDLNEAALEEVQEDEPAMKEEALLDDATAGPQSEAGVPEELQEACDDVDRCIKALRDELKRAKNRLTSNDRGLLRKKMSALGQKLASLTEHTCPD